ncbi:hypothetical protein OAO18_07675 [Francisellaceae bacterium]|nr:hypothetical protein [Francisellaceae bacterium]
MKQKFLNYLALIFIGGLCVLSTQNASFADNTINKSLGFNFHLQDSAQTPQTNPVNFNTNGSSAPNHIFQLGAPKSNG